MVEDVKAQVCECVETIRGCEPLLEDLTQAAETLIECLYQGGIVAFCGNGGSASQAQHFAAELVGRFRRERQAFRALSLSADGPILTAVGNDYCFEDIFARQVEGLLRAGDVLVGLSTSGRARNVCKAFEVGRKLGLKLIAFTGCDSGQLGPLAHLELRVPSNVTARVQEAHLLLGHLLCDLVEAALARP